MEDLPGPRWHPGPGLCHCQGIAGQCRHDVDGQLARANGTGLGLPSPLMGDLCLEPDLVGTQFAS